jgi:site-specific recombinase XerD
MRSNVDSFESILSHSIRRFLAYKRALGCRFDVEEKSLRLLDRYLVLEHLNSLEEITPGVLDNFLASRPRKQPRSFNHLLNTIQRLFDWLVVQGVLPGSPVQTHPKRATGQRKPFIFDRAAAQRLLAAAGNLKDTPRVALRGMTYRTIFALLYGLGLRVGEVSRLLTGDVDFTRGLLVIRETKFYKSRLVPFGPRIGDLLESFVRARYAGSPAAGGPLFSFARERAITPETISQVFHALVPRLELTVPAGTSPPRLHDLRHSFAVGTLLRWYRSGADPHSGLLRLSTFLGHVDPLSTAVYLTISDALLDEANRRFESFAQNVIKEGLVP